MSPGTLIASALVAGWGVGDVGGVPGLVHDGQPASPVFFWQAQPFEYEFDTLAKGGLHLYSLFSSATHYAHPYWKSRDEIDISYMTSEMDRVLAIDPEARFLPRIYAIAPDWWIRENPDERFVCSGDKGVIGRESFASVKARKEVGETYREVVRRLWARYGDRLVGIHVASGPWGEWFTWEAEPACEKYHGENPTAGDVSEPMRRAFGAFLKRKYGGDVAKLRKAFADEGVTFESVAVPTKAERQALDVGVWRDPAKSRRVMDYFECHHAVAASAIGHYCKIVKEVSPRLLTSVFYGYTQEETWGLECDHRAPSRAYRCPSVDVFASPHTYGRRRPGSDGGLRQYFSSAALHGKFFVDESDDRTHLELLKTGFQDGAFSKTMEDSLGVLWREFGNAVTRGCGQWYMDVRTGNFKDPQILDVVSRARKWYERALQLPRTHRSEVALVSNPESEFYFGYRNTVTNNISSCLYGYQMRDFYRAGVPFDWYLAEDLDAVVEGPAKVVVFLDCQYLTAAQLALVRKLRAGGRTLVWMHAPGYVSPENLSVDRMAELTGFAFDRIAEGKLEAKDCANGGLYGSGNRQLDLFLPKTSAGDRVLAVGTEGELAGRPVVVARLQGEWRSVFAAIPGLSADALRALYREAGVHVYTDATVVMSANENWLMLHANGATTVPVRLPRKFRRVTNVVTEEVVGENIASFDWKMAEHETAVFLMEH